MKHAFAIALLLTAATPALAQSIPEMQKLADEWAAAFNKGDIATVVSQYKDDATVFPPGGDMVKGKQAITALWTEAQKGLQADHFKTTDVRPLGPNAAREQGYAVFRTKGDNPQEMVGKYVVIWEKVDGKWKLDSDIWNLNTPPAPAKIAMTPPVNNTDIKWGPAPPIIPSVVKLAVISGDPSQPGQPYTVRLLLPANFKVAAHYHPVDESATVISGTFHIGMGDKLDMNNKDAIALQPGGFAYAPAGMHHYGWTDGETVIQINGVERCALRPGNVHSADGWDDVLKPVVARYQGKLSRIYFRADASLGSSGESR